eukprot:gnl/Ergobibamus_cyprinoides/359.p2 GENE.gnl/Ergobibamus_cyprinoides/359~~gnl/Ergobibamus_cyprinoides/359.p2  ORF type:complete len:139 (+),score=70.47 gnl/Ergobibamus_cyprinoides/359:414-830(+)
MNQLDKVIELTGRPSAEDIEAIKSPFAATMLESLPPSQPRDPAELFPSASPEALDLLMKMLAFNPDKRISAEDALRHPYVKAFHNPAEEPACPRPIKIIIDDDKKFSIAEYRDSLYQQVAAKKRARRHRSSRKPDGSE